MPKVITKEEYKERVEAKYSGSVKLLSNYVGSNCEVDVVCNVCQHKWSPKARKLLESGCPPCAGVNRRHDHDSFLKIFKSKYEYADEYEFLSRYVTSKEKMKVRHTVCGYEYEVHGNNLLNGKCCPNCSNRPPRDTEWLKEKVKKAYADEYQVVGEYVSTHKPVDMLHNVCGRTFKKSTVNFFNKSSPQTCPHCKRETIESKGEIAIRKWFEENGIAFTQPYSITDNPDFRLSKPFSFDFQVPYDDGSFKLVEYFGEVHFRAFHGKNSGQLELQQRRDKLKKAACDKHGIPLLVITYKDFSKIKEILQAFIYEE
jgi:ribosomal protein S18